MMPELQAFSLSLRRFVRDIRLRMGAPTSRVCQHLHTKPVGLRVCGEATHVFLSTPHSSKSGMILSSSRMSRPASSSQERFFLPPLPPPAPLPPPLPRPIRSPRGTVFWSEAYCSPAAHEDGWDTDETAAWGRQGARYGAKVGAAQDDGA